MISMIVAADENNAIGFQNELLCKLKDDMKHFVEKTKGKPVIMGATTFESLDCKPLKDRFNIVLTKSPLALTIEHETTIREHGNLVFDDFETILYMIEQSPNTEFVVIGGQKTYELFLPYAQRIYLTRIHHKFEQADTYFPNLRATEWKTRLDDYIHFERSIDNRKPFTIFNMERTGNPLVA